MNIWCSVAACSDLVYIKTKDTRARSSEHKCWAVCNTRCWTSPAQQALCRARNLSRTAVRTSHLTSRHLVDILEKAVLGPDAPTADSR